MVSKSAASESGQDIVVRGATAGVPANFELGSDELEGLSGLGYSEKAEDTLVPILGILQDNSGEVKKGHSKKMDGAEAGFLIMRSMKKVIEATKPDPLIVQPCGFSHVWVQWRGEPGEGQVITQYPYDDRPSDAVEVEDPQNPDRTFWQMPNGDRLVDTRYHYCRALVDGVWLPVVVPMAGTNHTVSRQWTGQMKATQYQGQKMPAWFKQYALYTVFNQRGAQSWYNYAIDDAGWVADAAQRAEGRALFESVSSGILTPVDETAPIDKVDADPDESAV